MTCCVKHILTVNAISIFNVYLCLFGSVYNELLYDDENVHEDLKVMLFCTSVRKVKSTPLCLVLAFPSQNQRAFLSLSCKSCKT